MINLNKNNSIYFYAAYKKNHRKTELKKMKNRKKVINFV